jgi:hypothetical protein
MAARRKTITREIALPPRIRLRRVDLVLPSAEYLAQVSPHRPNNFFPSTFRMNTM